MLAQATLLGRAQQSITAAGAGAPCNRDPPMRRSRGHQHYGTDNRCRCSDSFHLQHSHSAVCNTLLSHMLRHKDRLHGSHDAIIMMELSLLQMAEEGAAWEPPSKASITCAVVLPGMVIVATAQPHKLTALALNQPGSPSVRCEG